MTWQALSILESLCVLQPLQDSPLGMRTREEAFHPVSMGEAGFERFHGSRQNLKTDTSGKKVQMRKPVITRHACNPSIWEAETGN